MTTEKLRESSGADRKSGDDVDIAGKSEWIHTDYRHHAAPFLFDDPEHLEKCLDSEFGEKILSEISAVDNLEAIAFHEDGWRYVFTTDRKVSKLADMKGLKMRSMMSEMLVDMYKELGAVPLSISYSELYTSLQTGMVEAQDNGFVPTESDGFTEVLKNVCVSNHFYAGGVVVVADDWLKVWQKRIRN